MSRFPFLYNFFDQRREPILRDAERPCPYVSDDPDLRLAVSRSPGEIQSWARRAGRVAAMYKLRHE